MSAPAKSPSKALIVVLCCTAPLALFAGIWMMLATRNDGETIQQFALGLAIVCITFVVAHRAFESCTVRLDDAGVEQIKFMSGTDFFVKKRLRWSDIVGVSVAGNAYRLKGVAFEIPVRLMVFGDPGSVVARIKSRLPLSSFSDADSLKKP